MGDSLAYVYSKSSGHVTEVTQGSHDIQSNRDMRDALGALGPVDGVNPELSNLTCSMTQVETGDIVFLTSDGISDNFDPVVGKFCVPQRPDRPFTTGGGLPQTVNENVTNASSNEAITNHNSRIATTNCKRPSLTNFKKGQKLQKNEQVRNETVQQQVGAFRLPTIAAYQRHELTLLRMEDLLNNGSGSQSALPSKAYTFMCVCICIYMSIIM